MIKTVEKHIKSQENAWTGLMEMLRTQQNFQIELLCAIISTVLGMVLQITTLEWFMLFTVITLVLVAEIFNTSIEYACDAITLEKNPLIKLSKDMGAAAVLITALLSLFVGIIIFLPKLLGLA